MLASTLRACARSVGDSRTPPSSLRKTLMWLSVHTSSADTRASYGCQLVVRNASAFAENPESSVRFSKARGVVLCVQPLLLCVTVSLPRIRESLCVGHAPHRGSSYEIRQAFWQTLCEVAGVVSSKRWRVVLMIFSNSHLLSLEPRDAATAEAFWALLQASMPKPAFYVGPDGLPCKVVSFGKNISRR